MNADPEMAAERLRIAGLSKTFPGARVLTDISLDVQGGEVHALMGHNGSGKSTLIKILSGFHAPDPGLRVWRNGAEVSLTSMQRPDHQGRVGLAFVHQDLGLILEMTAVENFGLNARNRRSASARSLGTRQLTERLLELLHPLAPGMDVTRLLSQVSPVDRTLVAIAIALDSFDAERGVLVLDEPTATLPHGEVERLFGVVRALRDTGTGILYVSHRMDEIFDLSDRVTVLRDGRHVATTATRELTRRGLIELMLGDKAPAESDGPQSAVGSAAVRADSAARADPAGLAVEGLGGIYARDVSFAAAPGEILGFCGLPGSGSDEVVALLAGRSADARAGRLKVGNGGWSSARRHRFARHMAVVPADRGRNGVINQLSVAENLTLSTVRSFGFGRVRRSRERDAARTWMDRLEVIAPSESSRIAVLSGGNQQKVVVGRALSQDPAVLLVTEPTAGVDIGARQAIYALVRDHAARGRSVLVSSSDLADLTALCHRVLVFSGGRVAAELSQPGITENKLIDEMERRSGEHIA